MASLSLLRHLEVGQLRGNISAHICQVNWSAMSTLTLEEWRLCTAGVGHCWQVMMLPAALHNVHLLNLIITTLPHAGLDRSAKLFSCLPDTGKHHPWHPVVGRSHAAIYITVGSSHGRVGKSLSYGNNHAAAAWFQSFWLSLHDESVVCGWWKLVLISILCQMQKILWYACTFLHHPPFSNVDPALLVRTAQVIWSIGNY